MKKFISIILVNIVLFILVIFSTEYIIWFCENYRMKNFDEKYINKWPIPFHPGIKQFNFDFNAFPNPENGWGKNPVGLNYKNKPIVIFGNSFAYGYELAEEDTFYTKLSEAVKRPVYTRACPGWGIQHMLFQVKSEEFYKHVPEPEYAVFIMILDHFRRLYAINFMSGHLLNEERNLRYKLKNGELIRITDSNKFLAPIKRLYLTNKLHQVYVNNFILKERNYKNYSKFALEHFIESKLEMQKHWKNTKFVIISYHEFFNDKDFNQKLRDAGFQVISLPEKVNVDLNLKEYNIEEGRHPNGRAWDIITPIIIDELGLK